MIPDPDSNQLGVFKVMLESIPDAVVLITCELDSQYVAVNSNYCQMLGFERDELLDKKVSEFHQWGNELQARATKDILINGIPIDDLECSFYNSSHIKLVTSVSCRKVKVDNQYYLILSYRDIQARVLIEERLKESEARWRFAVEGHGDALWEWRLRDREIYRSFHFLSMLKLPGSENLVSLEKHCAVIHDDDSAAINKEFYSLLIGKKEELLSQCRLVKSDGQIIWITYRCRVMEYDKKNRPIKIIGTVRDVTQKRNRQKIRDTQLERLSHSGRLLALGQMTTTIAHEINQPLAVITSYAGTLIRSLGVESKAGVMAKNIEDQAMRAGKIIWRMRQFSRLGKFELSPLDLKEVIEESLSWVSLDTRGQDIQLSVDLPVEPLQVKGDRTLLEQVIINLVRNAIQSMKDMPIPHDVSIRGFHDATQHQVVVEIADRGCGLPTQVAIDVFQPFFTTTPEGLGLGLAITQSILERHHGKLWSSARTMGGTTFSFSVPL
ncbi:MAG: PAS domain S-box protein [Pseudomonadales bacterium]|nr:PAS domain S-box protein [Pseudomonadales bacterium]